jgi:hypothetical protein
MKTLATNFFLYLKCIPYFCCHHSFTLCSNNLIHDENENAKKLQNSINGLRTHTIEIIGYNFNGS